MNVKLAFDEPCLWSGAGGKEDEPNDDLTLL